MKWEALEVLSRGRIQRGMSSARNSGRAVGNRRMGVSVDTESPTRGHGSKQLREGEAQVKVVRVEVIRRGWM